jgi:predicted Fe-S protein YdhL (DUF1289 family)
MEEIARWGAMSPVEKWAVLHRTTERAGGRSERLE